MEIFIKKVASQTKRGGGKSVRVRRGGDGDEKGANGVKPSKMWQKKKPEVNRKGREKKMK